MDEAQFLALPEDQRKAFQRQLQAEGYYAGKIDGKSGEGTRQALKAQTASKAAQSNNQLRSQELDLKKLELEQAGKAREGEAAERQRREQSADPLTDTFLPFAAGAGVGGVYGELTNRGLDRYERGNTRALREIADELGPTKKLTSSQINRSRAAGASAAAERFAPSSPGRQSAAMLGRGLSYGIPAAMILNEYGNYQGRADDEGLTDAERQSNQQIANGLLGTATGLGVEGGRRFFFPSRDDGLGKALMRVMTARDFANRMDDKDAPDPKATLLRSAVSAPKTIDITPDPVPTTKPAASPAPAQLPPPEADAADGPQTRRHSERLISAARAAGATGALTKETAAEYLASNLSDENRMAIAKELGVKSGPNFAKRLATTMKTMASTRGASAILAGIVGASAAGTQPAEAADGGEATSGLGGRAVAGGSAALGAYGVSRLVDALKPAARGAITMAGDAMAPVSIDAMTDYSPDELFQGRHMLARNLPSFLRGGAIEDAYQMSQVPERNPERGQEAYYGGEEPEQAAQPQQAPAVDAETANAMKSHLLGQVSKEQMRQLANALASGDIAQRGDAFPQDPKRMQMVEALMGGAY